MTDKFCKDCKWCAIKMPLPDHRHAVQWYCINPGSMAKDPLTGEQFPKLCVHMRAAPEDLNKWHIGNPHCGPEGILFEPKQ